MKINKKLVSTGLGNHPSQQMEQIDSITIHTTGNRNPGATAEAHARLQARGNDGRTASWHYTVDENEIWQSFKDNQICWHTGTRRGNETSIGIEICVNSKSGFTNACENAAWLASSLLKKHGIEDVVQHRNWSGKNCPAELISGEWGVSWENFLDMLRLYKGNENEIIHAMRDARVQFDSRHWQKVFDGTVRPNQDWTRVLAGRIIDNRWGDIDADVIQEAFRVLLGTKRV